MLKMQIGGSFMKAAVFVLLCISSAFDIKRKEIPLITIAAGFLTAFGINVWIAAQGGISVADIAVSVLPGVLFLILSLCTGEKVGYGDGLFIIVLGLYVGVGRCLVIVCFGLLLSSAYALILMAVKKAEKNSRLPFLPFLTIGMGVSFFV